VSAVLGHGDALTAEQIRAELDDVKKEIRLLQAASLRLDLKLKTIEHIGPELAEHDDRLDDHDRQLDSLANQFMELRSTLHSISAHLERVSSATSIAGFATERLERAASKDREERLSRDVAMQQALDRLVDGVAMLLGPTVATKLPVITIAPVEP